MKKNITINLFGTLYAIDEDAVALLEQYLDNMKRYFSRRDGGDEIADDIEHRVAELFAELCSEGVEAITIEHVQDIIRRIGNPEELDSPASEPDEQGSGMPPEPPLQRSGSQDGADQRSQRKLFRDPDDKLLGGVMSGLCQYFGGTDPLPWRIILVVLCFFSLQVVSVVYIIAWALIPQARTAEDRLQMRGTPVNPTTLNEELMRTATEAGNYLRSPGFRNGTRSVVRTLLNYLAVAFKILLLFVDSLLMLCLLLFICLFVYGLAGGVGALVGYGLMTEQWADILNHCPGGVWQLGVAAFSALVCLSILIFSLLRWMLRRPDEQPMRTGSKLTLLILFILSLASSITFGVLSCMQLEKAERQVYLQDNTRDGYFMQQYDRDYLSERGWQVKAYRNCNVGNSLFHRMENFVDDGPMLSYMRFKRTDNDRPMEVQLEQVAELPAGTYHLEAVAYAKGRGVFVYARSGQQADVKEVAAEVPMDDPDGNGNLKSLPCDSLLQMAYFSELLDGNRWDDEADEHKRGWSRVCSASFTHPGGALTYGISNQAGLIGRQHNERPVNGSGLLDLRVVPDSVVPDSLAR